MKSKKDNNTFIIILSASLIIITSTLIFLTNSNKNLLSSSQNTCIRAGCSGQLCIDKDSPNTASTCEWIEIYKCYKLADCERQSNGQCGFTSNQEFIDCQTENSPQLYKPVN
ncbi:MAG: hypothetical protein WC503_05420 [Candidatus Shapirobacteria bacterium]